MGEKIFARQLGNVNTWTILKEMMKMIMMRMGGIIMTESEQEFSCLLKLYALWLKTDKRTDRRKNGRTDGGTDGVSSTVMI